MHAKVRQCVKRNNLEFGVSTDKSETPVRCAGGCHCMFCPELGGVSTSGKGVPTRDALNIHRNAVEMSMCA